MHFKNVDHWAHALYKKILNAFKLLKDCTSLLRHPIPVSVCEELLSHLLFDPITITEFINMSVLLPSVL